MPLYEELPEPKGFRLLKSMSNAKNFIRMLSWYILSDFEAIHP